MQNSKKISKHDRIHMLDLAIEAPVRPLRPTGGPAVHTVNARKEALQLQPKAIFPTHLTQSWQIAIEEKSASWQTLAMLPGKASGSRVEVDADDNICMYSATVQRKNAL